MPEELFLTHLLISFHTPSDRSVKCSSSLSVEQLCNSSSITIETVSKLCACFKPEEQADVHFML